MGVVVCPSYDYAGTGRDERPCASPDRQHTQHTGAHRRTAGGTLDKLGPNALDLDLALSGSTKVASTVSLEG